jgi:hypothetical protein
MKRLVLILAIFCFMTAFWIGECRSADTFVRAQSVNIAWDAIAPATAGEANRYFVYTRQQTGATFGTPIKVGETSELTLTVVVPSKGWWRHGVQTVGLYPDEVSDISWSDVPASCLNGETFGTRWIKMSNPMNLKRMP